MRGPCVWSHLTSGGWIAVATLIVASCGTSTAGSAVEETDIDLSTESSEAVRRTTTAPPDGVSALVVHVDDGDSLLVEIDGVVDGVRLIGINAPEQGECLSNDARKALADMLQDRPVILETDVEETDRFGRLLRYVWVDGELINETMAARGWAIARAYEPNVARQSTLDSAQDAAQRSGVGIWAPDACGSADAAEITVLAIQSDPSGRDEDNLNGEFVIFENAGGESADLSGFILKDGSSSNRYMFPDGFVIGSGDRFVVYVGCGADGLLELFWCSDGPVWGNGGDELFLTDPSGNIIAYDSY